VKRVKLTLSFHSRVLLLFVAVIVLAQLGTTVSMLITANRTAYAIAEQQLQVADRVVQKVLDSREQQLRSSVQILAGDFAFREAVATRDKGTIVSTLVNHGARVNADLVVLLDTAGRTIASTDASIESAAPVTLLDLLDDARHDNRVAAFVKFKGKLMQLVVVPLRGPDTIGWVCMGFVVGDDVVAQIKDIAGTDVTLVHQNSEAVLSVVASTLSEAAQKSMDVQGMVPIADSRAARGIRLNGTEYLTWVAPQTGHIGDTFFAVVQLPKIAVSAPLTTLRDELIGWGGIVTVLCLVAALLSARLLSQPVQALANAARSLRLSKRRTHAELGGGDDELENLAAAFHDLARRAHYDALTGLPNRALIVQRISASLMRAVRDGSPLSVVFIDLNGFKKINDSLGHEMGDLVLRKTAQRLTRSMRPSDTVARLGGDEFVLLLEGVGAAGALKIVDQLIPVVALPMRSTTGPIRVGMSAGIAVFPDHAADRDGLLRLADAAMYQSKTRRRGPVVASAPPAEEPAAAAEENNDTANLTGTWGSGKWKDKDLSTQNTKAFDLGKFGS
jgi:diguanylate cyclase (GGDEF)-like protein